jgi:hypothetical protein
MLHEKEIHRLVGNNKKALPIWSRNGILHYNVPKDLQNRLLLKYFASYPSNSY